MATDDLTAYDRALCALGCDHEAGRSKPAKGERGLGLADEAHRKHGFFLRPFGGVATRRLERYLQWIVWTCQLEASAADRRDLVTREAMTGEYDATIRSIFAESRFDMLLWECRDSAV